MSNSISGSHARNGLARRFATVFYPSVLLLFLISPRPVAVTAAGGDLDPSFGNSGKVTIDFNNSTDRASALALQPDGKILVAGFAYSNSPTATSVDQFALVRLNSDGTLDNSFGVGGKTNADFGGLVNEVKAIAIQSDGKIVAAGFAQTATGGYDFGLARFDSAGALDPTFGNAGRVTTNFSGFSDFAYAVVVRSDGKIIVAGSSQTGRSFDFALARYESNGTLDSTFGSGGKVTLDLFGREDEALAVALQTDGKILAAGYGGGAGQLEDFALARFNPDGSVDSSFGTAGKVTTDFGFRDKVFALAIQPDGKIIAGGFAGDSTDLNYGFALARYRESGQRDKKFGHKGKVVTRFSGHHDELHALAIDASGRLIAAGQVQIGFSVARYGGNGELDTSFGANGIASSPFSTAFGDSSANAVAIQSDGKIVAAGSAYPAGSHDFAVARFQIAVPSISNALITGKNLIVQGQNFAPGAMILLDGVPQTTLPDSENPSSSLIGKKVGKKIPPGQPVMLQVRNPDGATSSPFTFVH